MPVCVHCARPVPALIAKFGSGHVALSRCAGCGRIADPYLEYGLAILVIDLVRTAGLTTDSHQTARLSAYLVQYL